MNEKITDYYFLYQTTGFSVLLTDICVNNYGNFNTVAYAEDGLLRYYISNHDYKIKNKNSVTSDYENFEETLKQLNKNINNIEILADSFTDEISLDDFDKFYNLLSNICNLYSKFDHVHSDHIYTSSLNNKDNLIGLIQDNKNVIRKKINPIFISNDSLLNEIANKVAKKFGFEVEAVLASTVSEFRKLLSNEIEIPIRENSKDFFIVKRGIHIDYYYGIEAVEKKKSFELSNFPRETTTLRGQTILRSGKYVGEICKIEMNYKDFNASIKTINELPGDKIVVVESTLPEMVPFLTKSKGIITDMGGLLSHAAITSRELNKPCIVGTEIATRVLNTGDMVEIDTDIGEIRIIIKNPDNQ